MPYDQELDGRIAEIASGWSGGGRKAMFGGTCYLLRGNMVCGVYKESLILRLGEEAGAEALSEPFVRPFDITGRPMKGWVMVSEPGFRGASLDRWVEKARAFAATLPAK